MSEIYSKVYNPVGEATFGHKVFRQGFIPAADLVLNTAFTHGGLVVNYQGFSRQAFKVLPQGIAGPTVDVEIQEFLPDVGKANDGDPLNGTWALKAALGVGVAAMGVMFEHNQEDTMRLTRMVLTPRTGVPSVGIKYEMSGRRDT